MVKHQSRFLLRRRRHWFVACSLCITALLADVELCRGTESQSGEESAAFIGLNSVGYLPEAPKTATVTGGGDEFIVRDARSRDEMLRGRLGVSALTSSSDKRQTSADFSALRREGTYQLSVPGVGDSARFRIAKDVCNWPFYCSMRAMYLWRCGCAVEGEFGENTFRHAACHLEDGYLDHVGGPAGSRLDGTGGWHDAGDYNKYTVNGAFTAGMMLQAWEHFPDRLAALKLDIPESGNSVPDFLDEVRWEMDWLLKMQADDGRVYHKLSTLQFGGMIMPDAETDRRYFSPWGSAAIADLAAIMAQAARVFRPIDAEYADRCLAAAKKSYDFLASHTQDHRPDLSAFATGPYQARDRDDRLWAAAELWETTGEQKYLDDLERRILSRRDERDRPADVVDGDWDWSNVRNLGMFTYVLSKRPGRDPALLTRVREDAIRVADGIVEQTQRHPYARPLGSRYYWGCNGTVVRQAMNLHVAQALTGDKQYEAAMLDGLNHVLGRNPYGRSYVTGLGFRPPLFPHDRRSGGDQIAAPWPGCLVGGPWPRAGDWRDERDDYRTNEIAINWNGALIYALAAFVEPREFDASIAAARKDAGVDTTNQP